MLFGFLNTLLNLLGLVPPPTHFAVVLDARGKTFRCCCTALAASMPCVLWSPGLAKCHLAAPTPTNVLPAALLPSASTITASFSVLPLHPPPVQA